MNEPDPNNPAPSANPDPVPPSTPAPSIFSEGFNFAPDWADRLEGPDFDAHRATLAKFGGKSVHDLAKSYGELQQLMGKRQDGLVKLPGEGATPEEIAAYRKAVGVPESPDGYALELPEGMELREDVLANLRGKAHELGITPAQLSALVQFQAETEQTELARWQAEHEDATNKAREDLRREWGPRFETKLHDAKRVAETFGLRQDHPALQDAEVLRALALGASVISSDKLAGNETVTRTLSPENAAIDIQRNPSNPLHEAYRDSSHPNHQAAVAQVRRLHREAAMAGV